MIRDNPQLIFLPFIYKNKNNSRELVVKIYDFEQTDRALPYAKLIDKLEEFFRLDVTVPLRHIHEIKDAHKTLGSFILMPSWIEGKWIGLKTVSVFPNNKERDLPGLHSAYMLYDGQTGVPVSLLDGNVITSKRTAAVAALAAKYLSRKDSSTLLLIGSGQVARLVPEALKAVRPIRKVFVWSPTRKHAETLSSDLYKLGFESYYVEDLQKACSEADIISCATLSTEPIIHGDWLKPGTHLDLIGSYTPDMRETDDACFSSSSVFIDTEEALMKSGDLLKPIESGVFSKETVKANLFDLCTGKHIGRTSLEEITIFKAVGNAIEDLAAATLVMESY